jgi:hopanoid biosynthesis associated protein HpnK
MRLIVNADDFGLSEAINRGVIEAHEHGIVTATSLLATGAAFEDAIERARRTPTLDIGVHLALTGQRPVSEPRLVPSLVDAAGQFPADIFRFAARLLRGKVDPAELRRELEAQIRRMVDSGLPISHLDGHQHVQVLPVVAPIVAELARAHGIGAVRHPAERMRWYMLRDAGAGRRLIEHLLLNLACAQSPLGALRVTDAFVGFHFGGRLTETNLLTLLRHLPERGTVELMCHPGRDDPGSAYGHWHYAWARELEALQSDRVRQFLDARGVRLVSYRA